MKARCSRWRYLTPSTPNLATKSCSFGVKKAVGHPSRQLSATCRPKSARSSAPFRMSRLRVRSTENNCRRGLLTGNQMVCERPPRSLRSRLPLTRGRMRLVSPLQRRRAAEGGRGSLTHHLEFATERHPAFWEPKRSRPPSPRFAQSQATPRVYLSPTSRDSVQTDA